MRKKFNIKMQNKNLIFPQFLTIRQKRHLHKFKTRISQKKKELEIQFNYYYFH